ncbi:preprotein translocase subunit SecA, partial [Escherichia coli]|nr:preprotein translocase subunit SecA [Escherichia coli]EJO9114914.1 preprotein translocase subunit SecA [Escherichia coli]
SNIYSLINSIPLSLEKGVRKGQDKDFIESGDYVVDLKTKQVHLTEQGHEKSEKMMVELGLISEEDSLYSTENLSLLLHLQAALKAHTLFHLNQHYIIQDNEIKIVDEHTGRIMNGRRWSEGLHQAIEAKEGVDIQPENITQATITLQNYFRMYNKLSGMTGTADTEAFEFNDIYGLETIVVPTNKPIKRNDLLDQVFMTTEGKIKAIIDDVKYNHELGRPILIGTS